MPRFLAVTLAGRANVPLPMLSTLEFSFLHGRNQLLQMRDLIAPRTRETVSVTLAFLGAFADGFARLCADTGPAMNRKMCGTQSQFYAFFLE